MNATIAALLGSLIGAVAALSGSVLTSLVELRNARRTEESNTRTDYIRALRERSGAVFAQFFIVVQAIEWITWYGINDPDAVDEARIDSYENRVNSAYETLLGSLAMAASLNLPIYQEMRPILSKLYDLEARVARAIRQARSGKDAVVGELDTCRTDAATLREDLPVELNRVMVLAEKA